MLLSNFLLILQYITIFALTQNEYQNPFVKLIPKCVKNLKVNILKSIYFIFMLIYGVQFKEYD